MVIYTNELKKYILGLIILIVAISVCCISFKNHITEKNTPSLTFAHLTDTHYRHEHQDWYNRVLSKAPELLDEAINKINSRGDVKFVVFTGDLIDTSKVRELNSVKTHLSELNKPWYYSFGNHDRCHGEKLKKRDFLKSLSEINPNIRTDRSFYSFSPEEGYKIIIMDTINCTGIESMGKINPRQLRWLQEELDNSKNDVVMLFSHMPVVPPYYDPHHSLIQASLIQNIAESYKNPIIFFSGHYHGARIYQRNNVLYVSSPALISYPNAFRFVSIKKLKDRAIVNLKMERTSNQNIIKTARKIHKIPDIASGTKRDQSGTYVLKYRK